MNGHSKRQQGTGRVSVPEPRRASALLRRGGVVVVARHTSSISSSNEMTFTERAWTDRKVKERFGSGQERGDKGQKATASERYE